MLEENDERASRLGHSISPPKEKSGSSSPEAAVAAALFSWLDRHFAGQEFPFLESVLFWLLGEQAKRKFLKDLYRANRAPDPRLRRCVNLLIDRRLAVVSISAVDRRQRMIEPTAELKKALRDIMIKLSDLAPGKEQAPDLAASEKEPS